MTTQDALFEDMQALRDDAHGLGLTDVTLVLDFAMDVFRRETQKQAPLQQPIQHTAKRLKSRYTPNADTSGGIGWSMSNFPMAQTYRDAS